MATRVDVPRVPSRRAMRWRMRGIVPINLALWALIIMAVKGCLP